MHNHLISGDWNALCDSCGRKFKASQLRRRWDGMMVCDADYELRHPQEFLRVQKERISVPFARPYPEYDTFIPVPYIDDYCLDGYIVDQSLYVQNFEYPA